MDKRSMTVKAVVLGIAASPLGARVTAATVERLAPNETKSLEGLIARPHDFHGMPAYVGTLIAKDIAAVQGCDGSACFVDVAVAQFFGTDASGIPGTISSAYLDIVNYGAADSSGTYVQLDTIGNARIVAAPGCVAAEGETTWSCDVGYLAAGEHWSTTVSVESDDTSGDGNYAVRADVESSVHDSNLFNNSADVVGYFGAWSEPTLRITSVDALSCPSMTAYASYTDETGNAIPGGIAANAQQTHVSENGIDLGAPLLDQPLDTALSVAIVVENTSALDSSMWDAIKINLTSLVGTWGNTSGALPSMAVYSSSPFARLGTFSADEAEIAGHVAQLDRTPLPNELGHALAEATTDLSTRAGRRAIILLTASGDESDRSTAAAMRNAMRNAQVAVYGVALEPLIEPYVRSLADATHAFRQIASTQDELPTALARVADDLRSPNRARWTTTATGESDKVLRFDVTGFSGITSSSEHFYSQSGTPCVAACVAVRGLAPTFGISGLLDVAIDVTPIAGSTFQLTESLPYGFTPQSISSGGVWNSDASEIRWAFPTGTAPSRLEYTLLASPVIPLTREEDIAAHFQGRVSIASGAAQAVCGDAISRALGLHPADVNQYGFILDSQATAYASAWQSGSPWISGPAVIPIAYITRARQLASTGGGYRVDPLQDPPWVNHFPMPDPGARSVIRELPQAYAPGISFPVLLHVSPGSIGQAAAVEETPPAGWLVSDISDGGSYDSVSRKVRWSSLPGNYPTTVSYRLLPQDIETTPVRFEGVVSVDGFNTPSSGTDSIPAIDIDVVFANGFE